MRIFNARDTHSGYRFAAALVAIFAIAAPSFAADDSATPQTTPEGLNLVTNTNSRIVYVADDTDFTQYNRVMIVDAAVAFKKNWQRDYNRNVTGLDGRVSDKDVERFKEKIATEFKKVFTETMTESGHEIVTEAGADVIVLRPAIIDVVANAPDVRSMSASRSYVNDPGQMTLYLEVYDSVSGSMLAKIFDAKDASRMGPTVSFANKATNLAAVDRMLKSWATELSGHFGDVKGAESDE